MWFFCHAGSPPPVIPLNNFYPEIKEFIAVVHFFLKINYSSLFSVFIMLFNNTWEVLRCCVAYWSHWYLVPETRITSYPHPAYRISWYQAIQDCVSSDIKLPVAHLCCFSVTYWAKQCCYLNYAFIFCLTVTSGLHAIKQDWTRVIRVSAHKGCLTLPSLLCVLNAVVYYNITYMIKTLRVLSRTPKLTLHWLF
jgi:hypothetical protein